MFDPDYQEPVSVPARGRPKDPVKCAAILDAALKIFPEKGYTRTSMDAIAKAANVSKLTLYSHFADKEDLFVNFIERKCFEKTAFDVDDLLSGDVTSQEALYRMGRKMLDAYFEPSSIAIYRMMTSEVANQPKLCHKFVEAAMGGMIKRFVVILQWINEKNEGYHFPHLRKAAMQYYALAKGSIHPRLIFGHQPPPNANEQDLYLREAAALFLRAHRTDVFRPSHEA
jgi:TetR/AcrR family transcriptional regulator, mexJK operon transcriptional repressor